jgi:hypothetical protein
MSKHDEDEDGFFTSVGEGVIASVCAVAAVPLIALPLSAYGALFYLPLWRWFVVPLGVPDVGFWAFVGLRLVCSVLLPHPPAGNEDLRPFRKWLVRGLAGPPLALLLGAIIRFWLA